MSVQRPFLMLVAIMLLISAAIATMTIIMKLQNKKLEAWLQV